MADMGKSRAALDKGMPGALGRLADRLPAMLIDTLRGIASQIHISTHEHLAFGGHSE